MKWISVKDKYPEHHQNVKIKVTDTNGNPHELEAVFNDYPEYRSWEIKSKDNTNIHAQPTHWMKI